jgi:septum formation protein
MKKIILASTSPRRKEILSLIGVKFQVVASDYEEDMTLKMKPTELAKLLSKGKAQALAKKYFKHIIIGADTFVIHNNKLMGKPTSKSDAKRMLTKISGEKLVILTGFTIIDTESNKTISKSVKTNAYIKKLTPKEIDNYIKTKEPLDKAGAFAIQGIGSMIIRKIEGDFFSAVGLPLFSLAQELKKFGIHLL